MNKRTIVVAKVVMDVSFRYVYVPGNGQHEHGLQAGEEERQAAASEYALHDLQDHRPHVRGGRIAARQETQGRQPFPVVPRGDGPHRRRLLGRQEVRLGISATRHGHPLTDPMDLIHL